MPSQLRSLFPALALLALSTLNSQLSTASAQGTAFSYSGQLQVGGVPVTGLYDFQFSLSNAPSGGGSQVGNALVVSALGVTNGLFSTTMDFGPVFSNSPTWLAIGVRPAGSLTFTNLTPLQQILPTPYAVYAETAGYATVLANGVALGTGQGNAIDPSAGNSFIGGGFGNNIGAGSTSVTVGGGTLNYATGQYVTVGGGQANRATNDEATVGGGSSNNAGGPGTTVAGGQDNYASGQFAAVGGGYQNNASGFMAAISGGQGNQATDQYTTIGGGDANTASVEYGTVGGGVDNTALGYGTVGGGQGNIAGAYNATAGGGENNLASGYAAVVAGGEQNSASGPHAVVGGGNANFATNVFATVPGGLDNVAGGPYSFAAGYTAQATNDGAFVWSDDEGGLPFTSTNNNSFNVRASGGVRFVTGGAGITIDGQTVLTGSGTGGTGNTTFSGTITAPSFVSDAAGDFIAGDNNAASGGYSTVGGGFMNSVSAAYSTVSGGYNNKALNGIYNTVGGGLDNNATNGCGATVGGGTGNTASGGALNQDIGGNATVGGGARNQATNNFATVPGGSFNIAGGQYSFAAGQQAQALHDGSFVWADSQNASFPSTAADQFSVRAQGGVRFVTSGSGVTVDGQPLLTSLAAGALSAPVSIPGNNVIASPNTSYVATNASLTTINLPTTANVGDVVQVSGTGTGGWQVAGAIAGYQSVAWTPLSGFYSGPWESVASSSDGVHLVAVESPGLIFTSASGGLGWTTSYQNNQYWSSVASSTDGTHLVAVVAGGGIYTASAYMGAWTMADAPSENWSSVASSADGTHLVAVAYGGGIYTNSGATWTITSAPSYLSWSSVASSSDGTHLVAVAYQGGIYTSANSGVTWTMAKVPSNFDFYSVASSSDGTHLVAGTDNNAICVSTDSGANWSVSTSPAGNWKAVASSSDGTHLVAVNYLGQIYTSDSGGLFWTTNDTPKENWVSVASSSDGTHLVAVANGGLIYTGVVTAETVDGGVGASEQFQYLGGGAWQPVQANGVWSVSGSTVFYTSGDVGIGTSNPQQSLSVIGGLNLDQAAQNSGTLSDDALTFGSASGEGIASKRTSGGTQYDLEFYTAYANRMTIFNDGGVGIATNSDGGSALNVNGTVTASNPNGSALTIGAGAIHVTGAGQGTATAAFIQVTSLDNINGNNYTTVNNPLCNGDPNAILMVTHNISASSSSWDHPIGVNYNATSGQWFIQNEDIAIMPVGIAFNVLILKN